MIFRNNLGGNNILDGLLWNEIEDLFVFTWHPVKFSKAFYLTVVKVKQVGSDFFLCRIGYEVFLDEWRSSTKTRGEERFCQTFIE